MTVFMTLVPVVLAHDGLDPKYAVHPDWNPWFQPLPTVHGLFTCHQTTATCFIIALH